MIEKAFITMYDIALFCKTCIRDIENLKLLLNSIKIYNRDEIPLCLCISKKEKDILSPIIMSFYPNAVIFYDEDITSYNCKDSNSVFMRDWLWQQYVKIEFYKTNFAKHYVMLDTDCYFIKDFYVSDFLYDLDTPYIPVTDHLKAERMFLSLFYPSAVYKTFPNHNIDDFFGIKQRSITIDLPWILTTDYMKKFEQYLQSRNCDFYKILDIAPYEMQWYLEWVLYANLPYKPTSAFFFPFHVETQYQICRYLGFDKKIFERNYIGIVMNKGHVKRAEYKPSFLGKYVIRPLIKMNYRFTKGRTDYGQTITFKKYLLTNLFSIKNQHYKGIKHKVITFMWIKLKIKCK